MPFPPPWRVVEVSYEGLGVEDATGFRITYLDFSDASGRRDPMERMTRDEARRIANGIAWLAGHLGALGDDIRRKQR